MNNRRRLNLLAFPEETHTLFVMLITAAVLLSAFIGSMLVFLYGPASLSVETENMPLGIILVSSCVSIGLVFGLAFYIFRRHPDRVRKEKKLEPISQQEIVIHERVELLAGQIGIAAPSIEMPSRRTGGSDGQAFGVHKPYHICLGGGWRKLRKFQLAKFDALLLHEFAHIAGGDIWRTYLSDAVRRSFVGLLTIPFIFGVFIQLIKNIFFSFNAEFSLLQGLLTSARLVIQLLFSIGVMYFLWGKLLRTREFYADWRASVSGVSSGLIQLLHEMHEKEQDVPRFWKVQFHPSAATRLDALNGKGGLFDISNSTFLLTGILVSFMLAGGIEFVFSVFELVLTPLEKAWSTSNNLFFIIFVGIWLLVFVLQMLFPGAIIVSFLTRILTAQIARQTASDISEKRSGWGIYYSLGIPAFFFIVGLELGFLGAPFNLLFPNDTHDWLLEFLLSLPILYISMWVYLGAMRFLAQRILGGEAGDRLSSNRIRMIRWLSHIWLLVFFLPGLALSRMILFNSGQVFFNPFLIWVGLCCVLIPIFAFFFWLIQKIIFSNKNTVCSACGKHAHYLVPAVAICKYCSTPLGKWLFIE